MCAPHDQDTLGPSAGVFAVRCVDFWSGGVPREFSRGESPAAGQADSAVRWNGELDADWRPSSRGFAARGRAQAGVVPSHGVVTPPESCHASRRTGGVMRRARTIAARADNQYTFGRERCRAPARSAVTAPSGLPPRSDRGCWHTSGRPAVQAPRGAARERHRPCSP